MNFILCVDNLPFIIVLFSQNFQLSTRGWTLKTWSIAANHFTKKWWQALYRS